MAQPINIPPYWNRPQDVGEVWTLRKGNRVASCRLFTHPIGGEVRVTVDRELVRSEAGRDGMALLDLGLNWKEQFIATGWR